MSESQRLSAECDEVRRTIERRKARLARLDEKAALSREQLAMTIRAADGLFYDGYPGKALSLIRDTRMQLDAEVAA